jgi:Cys-tRNA synthase (O-phospho-L-seryl-tRNA:Cys-tRNA synthase)
VQYVSDITPHPSIHNIPLIFPSSPSELIEQFKKHLNSVMESRAPGAKVVVVLDSIVSNPGWLMPWREMVKICKEADAISLVDGAHSIGQEALDLKEIDPDFFVTVSPLLVHHPILLQHFLTRMV